MADQHSQVTLRPRSKLERLLAVWEGKLSLPQRNDPRVAVDLLRAALEAAGHDDAVALAERARVHAPPLDLAAVRATIAESAPALADHAAVRECLAALGQLSAEVLASRGAMPTVAPTPAGCRVAARLGYPGSSFETLTRALDAELPEGDSAGVAWRAHHALASHGASDCLADAPRCAGCVVRASCSYQGAGDDPAKRLPALAAGGPGAGG